MTRIPNSIEYFVLFSIMQNLDIYYTECTLQEVSHIFTESPYKAIMSNKWAKLGLYLDISEKILNNLQEDILLGKIDVLHAIEEIFWQWSNQNSANANLGFLLVIIKRTGQWKFLEGMSVPFLSMKKSFIRIFIWSSILTT